MSGYKRSVINMQIPQWWEMEHYYIDFILGCDGWTAGFYPSDTDITGYANSPTAPSQAGGAGAMPFPNDYTGNYIFIGRGSGTIDLNSQHPHRNGWTLQSDSRNNNVRQGSGWSWNVTDPGSGGFVWNGNHYWLAVFKYTGNYDPTLVLWTWSVTATNISGGGYVRDIHLCREDDWDDFLAGKVFRSVFKQQLIDLNPCAIRFMNHHNYGLLWRWRDRVPPSHFSYDMPNFNILKYGAAYCTSPDLIDYKVDAVGGTPASPYHGHVVYCEISNDYRTAGGTTAQGDTIATIVPDGINSSYSNITTSGTDMTANYHVGDVVQFYDIASGMTQMDYRIGTIQTLGLDSTGASNAKCFTVDIDCRAFGSYSGGGHFSLYLTFNLGGWGPRPLRFPKGGIPLARYGQGFLYWAGHGPCHRIFFYDKNLVAYRDAATGNYVYGAWQSGVATGEQNVQYTCPIAIEFCATLINELEEMIIAQGLENTKGPINPWINVQIQSMLSVDPDYEEADNVAIGLCDVLLNGNPSIGLSGIPSRCDIFVELSNETWNGVGTSADANYCGWAAQWRWGSAVGSYSTFGGVAAFTALRGVQMSQDLKNKFKNPRIKCIMAGQEVDGIGTNNAPRILGNSLLFNDSSANSTPPTESKPVYYGTRYQQATFTGTGSGANLTVSGLSGTISVGSIIVGSGVPDNTYVVSTPVAGNGIYVTNQATTASSASLKAYAAPITFFWGFATAPYLDPDSKNYSIYSYWSPYTPTYYSASPSLSGNPPDRVYGLDNHLYTCIQNNGTRTSAGTKNPSNGAAPSYWTDNGLASNASIMQDWVANGQLTVSSITRSFPATVTTTANPATKNFQAGDLVVLTNMQVRSYDPSQGVGSDWAANITRRFGYISNVTSTSFDMHIDAALMSAVTGGNVTRVSGSDQEQVYAAWLAWMANDGDQGQDIAKVFGRVKAYCATLNTFGVYHVNYEGWEENNSQGYGATYVDVRAFIGACKRSQTMASYMTIMMNNKKSVYGSYMPGVYTYMDGGTWGFISPNSYAFAVNGVEWSGLSKSWRAMCDYNANAATRTIKFIFSR